MRAIAILGAIGLAACSGSGGSNQSPTASATPPMADEAPIHGEFLGRVWVSTSRGRPLGSMLVFLPDRTLLMGSCFETYRISQWGVAGDHVRWLEDTVPIEAAVAMPSPHELTLKIVGMEEPQTYIAAPVPYVCPDMPK